MPEGRCVMRTADSTLLTFWPPWPPARNVSMRRSSGLTLISMRSSISGMTKTEAKRGVAAGGLVERRNAHQAMHAAFAGEHAVGVFAFDLYRGGFDAGFFAGGGIENRGAETFLFRPAQIHAQEHFGPVLRFGAAGAGFDGDDGVEAIVFAG